MNADPLDQNNIRKLADSAVLLLASRCSALIIVALCGWILNSILTVQTTVATVMAKIDGHESRIANIETWRNNLDAYADDSIPTHRR